MDHPPSGQGQFSCSCTFNLQVDFAMQMPQQRNAYDCGVFAVLVLIHLQSGAELNHPGVDDRLTIPEDGMSMSTRRRALRAMIDSA